MDTKVWWHRKPKQFAHLLATHVFRDRKLFSDSLAESLAHFSISVVVMFLFSIHIVYGPRTKTQAVICLGKVSFAPNQIVIPCVRSCIAIAIAKLKYQTKGRDEKTHAEMEQCVVNKM